MAMTNYGYNPMPQQYNYMNQFNLMNNPMALYAMQNQQPNYNTPSWNSNNNANMFNNYLDMNNNNPYQTQEQNKVRLKFNDRN